MYCNMICVTPDINAKAEVVDGHDLINQAEAVWNDPTVIMCNNCISHMNNVTQTVDDANDSRVCT